MFKDMNGNEIKIGDILEPVQGLRVRIISEGYSESVEENVMYGQQVDNMDAFSILTQDNLAKQFKVIN